MAVAAPAGRADGDEDGIDALHGRGGIGREGQAPGGGVLGDQRVKPGLIDRDDPGLQPFDLRGVLIDADDVDAEL